MPSQIQISFLLSAFVVCWTAALFLFGAELPHNFFRPFSVVTIAIVLLLTLFDRWIWKLAFLQGWFVQHPNLQGTWRIILQSTWRDPNTLREIPPIEAFLVVRQRYSSLRMRLLTPESVSNLLGAEVLVSEDGGFQVIGVYRNEPIVSVRHRSPIHYGGILLNVLGTPPEALRGHYWTDRNTRGEMITTGRNPESANDFLAAKLMFSQNGSLSGED